MKSLARRLTALESSIPEKQVIFVCTMGLKGDEITEVLSGGETWTRQLPETEQEFLSRVKTVLEVKGPYPRFAIVS